MWTPLCAMCQSSSGFLSKAWSCLRTASARSRWAPEVRRVSYCDIGEPDGRREGCGRLCAPCVKAAAGSSRKHGRACAQRRRGHGGRLRCEECHIAISENLTAVVKDVDAFVRHVSKQQRVPLESMVVLAHSVGAVTVAAWVHDFAPPIRGLILAVPAFRVKLYLPF